MNCIIIDDDPLSCRLIAEYILKTEGFILVDAFNSPKAAINKTKLFKNIDILFLDVEMPEMSGFDFLNCFETTPIVIIMSSKEAYAVDAFSFSVTDFLLKPVTYPRFLKACEKAENSRNSKQTEIPQYANEKIFLKQHNSLVCIKYSDINYVEALENYSIFFTNTESYTIHQSLKAIEEKLPNHIFKRIHKSYIVNLEKVHKIEDLEMCIGTNANQHRIPIGKSYRSMILKTINSL